MKTQDNFLQFRGEHSADQFLDKWKFAVLTQDQRQELNGKLLKEFSFIQLKQLIT
jgi:hypothetical protein